MSNDRKEMFVFWVSNGGPRRWGSPNVPEDNHARTGSKCYLGRGHLTDQEIGDRVIHQGADRVRNVSTILRQSCLVFRLARLAGGLVD
jgi:hypothetical protein